MVHHSAVALKDNRDAPGRWRQHQRHHQAQGWPDIAYHVGVDRRGNLYELRDPWIAGDTFTEYDPAGWLLVVAEGDFDEQQPTGDQLEGIAQALAWGATALGGDPASLASHRDHAATSCPGDALHARVRDGSLAARVRDLVAGGGVEVVPLCGEAGRAHVSSIESGGA
ncbi:MAG: peptidoglycan recognition protein family protein [Nitriliruptorales bacterium]